MERIDLYQVHWPSQDGTPLEEYWRAMLDLSGMEKSGAVGLSNHDAAQLARAERSATSTRCNRRSPRSAGRRQADLPWCAAHETGVIVYSPMQSGLLSGGSAGAVRAACHRTTGAPGRRISPAPGWTATWSSPRHWAGGTTPWHVDRRRCGRLALAWPGVTAAIVGARNAGQVDGWVGAPTVELEAADLDEIGQAIERTGAGSDRHGRVSDRCCR